jgi:hypothetical protein
MIGQNSFPTSPTFPVHGCPDKSLCGPGTRLFITAYLVHTKRDMTIGLDRQPNKGRKTYSANTKNYSGGPASYLCSWTGVPRAEAGGPGISGSGMPLAVTV